MNDSEKQFEKFVRGIKFNDTPDPNHRDKLEQKLLAALAKQPQQERIWRIIMKTKIAKFVAAAVIAVAVLLPLSYGATKLIRSFITIRQLPAAIKYDGYGGALSPDGKHFASTTLNSELVVIDTSTGEQRKLAENCDPAACVWSADGSEIAVTSRDGQKRTLLAVSLKTGKTRSLMEEQRWFTLEDWSPDGKFISAVRATNPSDISVVLVNLENKKETVLAEELGASPRFSPNADCISYVTKQSGRSILHLQKIDGTGHVKYTDFPGGISQPLWSPDGSYIVFTGTQKGIDRDYTDLWALRVQNRQFVAAPFPVVPDVGQITFSNWSQNGQLAYQTSFSLGGIFTLPVDLQTGKATGPPRQLVRLGGAYLMHCWSPDGKQIAVHVAGKMTFLSASTGEQIRQVSLPEITNHGRGVSWSPDGKWIVFSGMDREKRIGIFLITVETGEVKLLVPQEGPGGPTWSPDGKTIAFDYKKDVYVVNIEDGKPRRLTFPADQKEGNRYKIWPVFAPDGGSVAYILTGQKFSTVMATTIDGKETREVLHLKNEKPIINFFDWSPDGRHIVFSSTDKEIWCAPTDGSEPFQIADISDLGSYAIMPKWSPKGDAITFYVSREKYQYWVMENLLPVE